MPRTKKRRARKWKKLSSRQEQTIMDFYNAGIKRNKIVERYKISDWQLVSIVRNRILTDALMNS